MGNTSVLGCGQSLSQLKRIRKFVSRINEENGFFERKLYPDDYEVEYQRDCQKYKKIYQENFPSRSTSTGFLTLSPSSCKKNTNGKGSDRSDDVHRNFSLILVMSTHWCSGYHLN